jgi:tetratricopeptide (TPR) repeat protein
MRLKRPVIFFILLVFFLAAIATRSAMRDQLDTPYFEGESAMTYGHALAASEGVPLDTISTKANHPGGYTPARYRADGFETAWALSFRAARFVSEVGARDFARGITVLLSALCVFTMYAATRRLWDDQASGLLAAFLVAFLLPFVLATNGREFTHAVLVPLFVSTHAAVFWKAVASRSLRASLVTSIGTALAAFVLAVSWEPALLWLAVWSVTLALWPSNEATHRERNLIIAGHACAVLVACFTSPFLVATRAIGSLPAALLLAATAVVLGPRVLSSSHPAASHAGAPFLRHPRQLLPAAFVFGIAALLWVVMTPVRAGATEQFPALAYVLTRVRHLFGRPDSPTALSEWMRHLWSLNRAPLPPYVAIGLLLPIGLLVVAWAANPRIRARRRTFIAAAVVTISAATAALADRSTLPVATLALIAVAAGSVHSLSKSRWRRAPLAAAGVLVAFLAVVFRGGTVDVPDRVAHAAGIETRDPHSFLWVSLENTDRELVRFVATRTSVREAILAPDDLSALLLMFSGRTVATLPAGTSRLPAERHVVLTRALYQSEEELYERCRTERIDYVVYSIDVLLDTGRYSPRYLAGVSAIDPASAAYRMHFEPEGLSRFTLRYENEHYRLFDVTGAPEVIFATDHPPVYQRDMFAKANRDLDAFRRLTVEVMLTFSDAVKARARGNAEGARRRLEWCLEQSPRFSRARLALADAFMDLNRTEDARRVVAQLIAYAPDNPGALYYAAYLAAQAGHNEEAKSYLDVLFTVEQDPDALKRARELQMFLDQGVPPRTGAPRDG